MAIHELPKGFDVDVIVALRTGEEVVICIKSAKSPLSRIKANDEIVFPVMPGSKMRARVIGTCRVVTNVYGSSVIGLVIKSLKP